MNTTHSYNDRQLLALAVVIFLSPSLRLFPSTSARLAGRAVWLSALAAAPVLLLYILFLCRFMGCRREGEGLPELFLRALGEKAGRALLFAVPVWLLLYAGFVLRSGADRLITTIYPLSPPAFFTLIMGILCLIAALGSLRSILRVAKLCLPLVCAILLLILGFALFGIDKTNLLPVTGRDAVPVLLGALPVINVLSVAVYLPCFAAGPAPKGDHFRSYAAWLLAVCVLLTLLCASVVGSFGPELTARLTRPFFSLVRNLVFFNSLERVEALVVTLWIFPDFLLVSLLLFAAQFCLRLALGEKPSYRADRRLDMSGRRWLIWFCAAAAVACGLLIAPEPEGMALWSEKIIPALNMCFAFLVLPAVWVTGKLRKVF